MALDLKKYAIIFVLFVLVIFISGCTTQDSSKTFGDKYALKLEKSGWTLSNEYKSLDDFPFDLKVWLMKEDVQEAATWTYLRDDDKIYIWVKQFGSNESLHASESVFIVPVAWRTKTNLGFGDKAMVGVFAPPNDRQLLFYAVKGNMMYHIAYYNQYYNGREVYNSTGTEDTDKIFLINLGRELVSR